ncbi:MAG: hypothetical protein EVG15_10805 [Candidatus Acididesulfobacter diazotrophicus]|jgi:hypothetical protein|uniref:Bacterial toxin RNase RnlA/LsoA DBD domain-containing protein n=1 Tax=Candidatus Acididesulfobacter diazotrophicus TaxID=2597226 RepID=A0A519BJS3_9DELT|nr:MAG: hypothetical protein EVG15_10805 [Candidatus Acididesulfobacter diazotrophicus]
MDDFKNLNINIDDIDKYLKEFASNGNGKCEIKNIKTGSYQFFIEIPGNKKATLNIYETKNGITIYPITGANQELSLKLAKEIVNNAEKVKTSSQSFESIPENLFDEFLQYLGEEKINIQEKSDDDIKKIYKLKNGHKLEITVTYYKTNHKVFIQGKNTKLFKDAVIWFVDKTIKDPDEIIKIVFNSINDFDKYKICFSDNLAESELKNKIGAAYDDNLILYNEEKKWLKVSFYLLNLDMNLPEYYHAVAGSIKVIEGILNRILLNKCGHDSFKLSNSKTKTIIGFAQFEWDCKLKSQYKNKLDASQIKYIEVLYSFIRHQRHELFHNSGINPRLIENKKDAESIFNEIIQFIINANNSNVKELFL